MRALVLRQVGQPAAVDELTLRPIASHEVRVRLAASGVCHTDLSVRDGGMPALLPCTLGHEGAGIVTEVGDGVGSVAPGDHVVLTWNVPCRSCWYCLRGDAQLCAHGLDHAFGEPYARDGAGPVWPAMGAGTLAEETLLPAAAAVPVDPSLRLDHAALLGCAVITGVGAVLRTAVVRPGQSVLVIGCGGVGLAAIQGARLTGAAPIIAADRVAGQLPAATANGATDTVDAADLVTAVRELTGGDGVDHAIEVVGKPATIRAAYDAARRGGTVTVVGAAGIDETVSFPALSMMADGKTIRGCVYGGSDPARDIPTLAALARRGRLDLEALVTRRIGIDDVETAFTDMAAGHGARSVVCFDA
ncbi:alcohol dehydrogenase [Mycobacterium sp. MFM001]|uniref:Zn-dependent alcohol dehydrogenase n=1 Tax=Mycobacterium sp. MFM001 TaxID=2049453 RepID=UPI000DA5E0CC|nr:Zn-dependent alcohol dehydrogenase [Mycobacterium sp. MFM001]GBE65000.1 alcohol dehydrogenase [Mycobacterium sp. MFM001]